MIVFLFVLCLLFFLIFLLRKGITEQQLENLKHTIKTYIENQRKKKELKHYVNLEIKAFKERQLEVQEQEKDKLTASTNPIRIMGYTGQAHSCNFPGGFTGYTGMSGYIGYTGYTGMSGYIGHTGKTRIEISHELAATYMRFWKENN